MKSLVHYGKDKLLLNGREYLFEDFLKLEPDYTVPFGFTTRVYKEGSQHFVTDGFNSLYLRKVDPYCNRICDREGELARLVERIRSEPQD